MAQMNNNRQMNNSYFDIEIRKNGDNFIFKKNSTELHNDAIRIVRDLVRGKIDVNKYQGYFMNERLREALLHSCNIKYSEANLVETSLRTYIDKITIPGSICQDGFMLSVLDKYVRMKSGYSIILRNLNDFYNLNNIGYLIALIDQAKPYKNYI